MDKGQAELRKFARQRGADLLGIASLDRFAELKPEKHPCSIFPEAKSVIVLGRRITRGTLRGVEEGTHFQAYDLFGYNWLDNRFVALTTFEVVEFLEDNGWEAVPLPALPPQIPPLGVPVRKGQPAPNVLLDLQDAAVRAGLGEIGYCGVLLTPQFGPRQRLQIILTDAELEPDPLFEGLLCDRCLECVKSCPLGAMSTEGEKAINICGRQMVVASIDFNKCRNCRNGARPNAYHPAGEPDRLAALCLRSCLDHLERTAKLTTAFQQAFRKRPVWAVDETGRRVQVPEEEN
ncbi:MAG TPA: hypothetical protein EYP85_02340 [Armatimonadetes bacterium]|nr:hypothetical protein [Armatimonadota bacterium]